MDTRQRILDIARDLFARQGYAGTSIADIAGELGTTKAALYYHFRSKADIADALLAEPLAAYSQLADQGAAGQLSAEVLLGALIDTTAAFRALVDLIGNDPSIRSMLEERTQRHRGREIIDSLVAALAGTRADRAGRIRARAAYAVAKDGTLAAVSDGDGRLSPSDRAEILAAALRALEPDVENSPPAPSY